MRSIRTTIGLIFILFGIAQLILFTDTNDSGKESSAVTIFCTGLILVFCGPDKNYKP